MKILYLTFCYEPDLGAGSFRNTSLAKTLSMHLRNEDFIDLITTTPHRYYTYNKKNVANFEKRGKLNIYRILVSSYNNGYISQIRSFMKYFFSTLGKTKKQDYDLVFASSSKLFTAFLGLIISKRIKKPLYLDIRDIFVENIQDIIKSKLTRLFIIPLIKVIEKITFNEANHINLISEGFKPYFKNFKCKSYSYFTHGIDENFLKNKSVNNTEKDEYTIVYAGNIGEGQGLEKIIPSAAEILGNSYKFVIIGDGKTKIELLEEVDKRKLTNVIIKGPCAREELMNYYSYADYLFLHLNNYKAFEKVLPSKIFELAAYDKPIIAGVIGFSYQFIKNNIPNVILFESCDVNDMVYKIKTYNYKNEYREKFIKEYKRKEINNRMAQSIINSIHKNDKQIPKNTTP